VTTSGVPSLRTRKRRNGAAPLVMITAYDEPTARYADAAGVDILLVGDSLANVVLGHEDTLHVTVAEMAHHVRAVAAATPRAHLVADMPWLSYHVGTDAAVANAGELIRAGAQSVKLEGGAIRREVVRALIDAEIPVMGHLGLTPQSVLALGGYKVQAKTRDAAKLLLENALILQSEGVYSLVIEGVPRVVGTQLTQALDIPTIGIGAGPDTDGQVLVIHDMLGLSKRRPPKFVRSYADLGAAMTEAVSKYAQDVRDGTFPSDAESYDNPGELLD
jgi:3-methyl-2-oxobutanoate hydroxymethyltransferase